MSDRVRKVVRGLALGMAGSILAYGLYSEDWHSTAWGVAACVTFGLPLALQFVPSTTLRAYGLWFGLFMVAQSLLTPLLRGDHAALPPDMKSVVDVTTDAIPGYPPGRRQVSTDARGWRTQPPVDYGRKTGVRIVAVGGSTTEDIVLDDRATWTHRLQLALAGEFPGVHVVNTGVSGLRAVNHAATLRVVADVQPDLVLVLLGGNDWNKHIKDHFEPGRDRWAPLAFRQTALPTLLAGPLIGLLRRQAGGRSWADTSVRIARPDDLNGGRRMFGDRSPRHDFFPAAVTAAYAADLQRLGNLCRDRRLRCLFLTQPHAYGPPPPRPELAARFWMTPPYADYGLALASMSHVAGLYNGHLVSFASREGHGLCDVASGMPPEQVLFYDDMHFTDRGGARMADLLAPCVGAALRAAGRH